MRKAELADAISKVKTLVAAHNLTQADIFGKTRGEKPAKEKGSKVAAKYRDPATGKEWSGRGLAPKWLQGKDKAHYLIA
jgi:DNA-binding protein H-NS